MVSLFKRVARVLGGALVYAALCSPTQVIADPGECLSQDEAQLLDLINDYRADNGLAPVPWTVSLSATGQWHAWDYPTHRHLFGKECTMYSWSDAMPLLWTGMCYTSDHAQAPLMWSKPREISGGIYTGNGFEIVAYGTSSVHAAFNAWKSSPPHNDMILNQSVWDAYNPWPAMGAGVNSGSGYHSVWFGSVADPQGLIDTNCPDPATPGRIDLDANPLTIAKSVALPGSLELTWGPSTCSTQGPSDYSVHAGTIGDFDSHSAILCDTGGALFDATVTPGVGSEYYLIVPITDSSEGSYGEGVAGAERPTSLSRCHAVQDLGECSPPESRWSMELRGRVR